MAFDQRGLDDYIDVPQRIADFRAKHPGGALQPHAAYEIVRVPNGWCRQCIGRQQIQKKDKTWIKCPRCGGSGIRAEGEPKEDVFIVYTAAAYRGADDAKPGIGMAWEPFPGQTPYTAGSELMNAETSAWGRAIVAGLASDSKRGVASREEVRNRAAEHDGQRDGWDSARPARPQQAQEAAPDGSEWETAAPAEESRPAEHSGDTDDGDWGDWPAAIEAITSQEDAERADADLREVFKAGAMGPTKARNIREAIKAKAASLGGGTPSPNGRHQEEVPA